MLRNDHSYGERQFRNAVANEASLSLQLQASFSAKCCMLNRRSADGGSWAAAAYGRKTIIDRMQARIENLPWTIEL